MLTARWRRLPLPFISFTRQQTNTATDLNNDNLNGQTGKSNKNINVHRKLPPTEKAIRDKHLANITVTSFYCQTAIEQLAAKVNRLICCLLFDIIDG
jgi:hypothetical protein